jgi:MATE family multidrug resistance protein
MSFTRTTLRELRPTLRLAAPITAGQVGQMLMGVTDTVMVGHVGTLALAACAFGNTVLIVVAIAGFGVRMHDAASARSPSISTTQARQLPSGR